ncbi:protein SPIRAL1-like 1 [Senna tora]|uniref:Protein SPIRAL1-like 1 n=1 Tax=Senna tora TaxID=362788 RepID=A0A834TKE0_9FABA|nr:protein SPIRAL1-like 1 [Senna tora]
MGRGVSSGGGQSSLGYLFGTAQPAPVQAQPANGGRSQNVAAVSQPIEKQTPAGSNGGRSQNAGVASPPSEKQTPAGVQGHLTNNYHRADGQNCGNFITDRPSTKVHAAPGGGSSLDYLFGGPPPGN